MENYDEAAGGLLVEHRMVAVTRPEVHTRIHPADNTGILAASLVASMKQEVARDPAAQISKKYNISTNMSFKSDFSLRISKLENDFLLISR